MKLLVFVIVIGYQRALTSIVNTFLYKKTGSGAIATSRAGVSVNEQLAEELHNIIKNSKEEKSMRDLKIIFGQLI